MVLLKQHTQVQYSECCTKISSKHCFLVRWQNPGCVLYSTVLYSTVAVEGPYSMHSYDPK